LIILSTSPHSPKEAEAILDKKIKYFKLEKMIDEVYGTKDVPTSKGEYIEGCKL